MGPFLFIVYINEIPEIPHFAKFILYADNANTILTAEILNFQHAKLINSLVIKVESNGLAFNVKKRNI